MIYLDNAATTGVYPEVASDISEYYISSFYNPSATYKPSVIIKKKIGEARIAISEILNCQPNDIYFNSCATEGNNTVLKSAALRAGINIIVSETEHACVYETAKFLKSRGVDIRFAPVNKDGTVDIGKLKNLIDTKTALVSVIHVSNETGTVNDLAEIVKAVKSVNLKTLVHSDGVQAFCKIPVDVKKSGIDFYTTSGHKIKAPKGIGVIYIKSGVNLFPLLHGGGQENGIRSGTENVAGIIAIGNSAKRFYSDALNGEQVKMRRYIIDNLCKVGNIEVAGSENNSGFILSLLVGKTKAEILQTMCADDGILIGRGSACSGKKRRNRVLEAMGYSPVETEGAVRISLSVDTSWEDIYQATEIIKNNIQKLRGNAVG